VANKLAIYQDPVVCRQFHVGASLHSHTLHSQECLFFLDSAARKSVVAAWLLKQGKAIYHRRTAAALELNSVYWTPPLAPHDAYTLEANQLVSLGLAPIVSLTDHDDIDAGLTLSPLGECRLIPISFEWTVPFHETFFHLGLHNLPRRGLHETFRMLQAWRQQPVLSSLSELLSEIASVPDTLVVFNHPFWNESSGERDLHIERAKEFVRSFRPFLDAVEINGMRSPRENQDVIAFAQQFQKPVVAGGDRHATEANVLINLTNAQTFAEFTEEVRAGYSSILEMPAYRETARPEVRRETREGPTSPIRTTAADG
jgi:hypothetical protein